jgi:ATP adenylyltransferase
MGINKKRPLWAPWRIKFITSEKTGKCFLCEKKKWFDSEEEDLVIARGKHVFAILNRYPYNSGHVMIAPYAHVNDLPLLDKKTLHELMDMTVKVEKTILRSMHPQGFNVGFNLGSAAGAGLENHIHLHIVPRWVGDTNFMPVLSDTRVVPQALSETAAFLRAEWKKGFASDQSLVVSS